MSGFLYKTSCPITDKIKIIIPKVGNIIDSDNAEIEDSYYSLVYLLTAMPIDLMVQLDDMGIDFTKINEYELFIIMFEGLKSHDTSLIFGDLNLNKFQLAIDENTGIPFYIDEENDIKINRAIYEKIASTLRTIHHLEKNNRKPGNKEARDYLLERARKKLKRKRKQENTSQLEPLIIAMVNTEQYKYDFEGTRELSIYQFNESVRQIIKKVDYDNKMFGVYTGNISAKDLSQDDLNWLIHK